jgi:hypothetical protein
LKLILKKWWRKEMCEYKKNNRFLYRKEDAQKYLLFNPYNRTLIMLSNDLFDVWFNLAKVTEKNKNNEISDSSFQIIMSFFEKYDLVVAKSVND